MAAFDDAPLLRHVPPLDAATPDRVLQGFLAYIADLGLSLYAAQEEAILELFSGRHVILATPTGSGKSLVAQALHFQSFAEGHRSFYTCPIKALVSEKFFDLCRAFGPEYVGMITGDASVNRDAPIVCCTAEILANMALREGADLDADAVIMDEFHYYADKERGVAWQVPLLTLPRVRFLLMSATLGPVDFFARDLEQRTGRTATIVHSTERPVPLDYQYQETPLHETLANLVTYGQAPVYVVHFTQRACAETAQNLMSTDYTSKDNKRTLAEALREVRFDSPYGKDMQRYLRHGIGLHHAGLLPKYRLLVEKLAQQGLLKIICGTDTLGVGVNVPIRTVLFTQLFKYDGDKLAILSVRDFQQIAGRAGRKGFDIQGSVVAQAPEHVVENLRLEQKATTDPAKRKKIVKKKAPERGFVLWNRANFERLTTASPEPLVSRFSLSHAMLLNVLGRPQGGCQAMKKLVRDSHESPAGKRRLSRLGRQLFRSLVQSDVVTFVPRNEGGGLRVNVNLQDDFSLNQSLSLYLLATIPRLDPDDPAYALDLLTLVESVLENPDVILRQQLDRLKTTTLAELKAAGVDYDERMAQLEKLEFPKPNREFIYDTFNAFAKVHPWVGENIRPKSVAREMYETYASFADYIKDYGLQRTEGVLLRYVTDVYKTLAQTVPESARNEDVDDLLAYFRALVRDTDASLLDEWERMRNPQFRSSPEASSAPTLPAPPMDITADRRSLLAAVRNEIFRVVRALASRDYPLVATLVQGPDGPWNPTDLEQALAPYFAEHDRIRLDPTARTSDRTRITEQGQRWRVEQTLVDPADHNDWTLDCVLDLNASRTEGRPVLVLHHIGP